MAKHFPWTSGSETAVATNPKVDSLWEQLKKTTQADIQKKRKKASSNWNNAQQITEVVQQLSLPPFTPKVIVDKSGGGG